MKSIVITKKYAIDSEKKLPKKSILRHVVFTKTTRQRSSYINFKTINNIIF